MKKTLSLVLALLMLLSLFAGCGSKSTGTPQSSAAPAASAAPAKTSAPASTDSSSSAETAAPAEPAEPDSPYNYPVGKYEKNADGYPTTKYVYESPICTNDEVLTKWSTCYTPQYIPEDGWGSIPTWKGVRDYTGVHIEYNIVDSANRSQNFSVLLASDDLDEICDQGTSFYKAGSLISAIEEGYFVNLIDYIDYMPCYMYEAYVRSRSNKDVLDKIFYNKDTIISMTGMLVEPAPGMGYFVREDWMEKLGLGTSDDLVTYDQIHNALMAFKSAYSTADREIFPFVINNCVENAPGCFFGGFGTAIYTTRMSYIRVKDGVVMFCGTDEDDREAMTLLSSWYADGLISPNFQTFVPGEDYDSGSREDGVGINLMPPSSWQNSENAGKEYNPDCDWEPIKRPRKAAGQVLDYGGAYSNFHYGSAVVTGNCHNVELAVTWLDWWMSDWGSEWTSWGPEGESYESVGYLWYYNEKGERRLTDWCFNNEASMAWIMCLYGCNGLVEFCLQIHKRNYAFDGGERSLGCFDFWEDPTYRGAYDWPSAVKLSDDESDEYNQISSDLSTFYIENYVAFVDGSKPMSDWDAYIESMNSFGYQRAQEIYQTAYDRYMAGE